MKRHLPMRTFAVLVLAFLCMSAGPFDGVAQAATIGRATSLSANNAANPSSLAQTTVATEVLSTTNDACYPATCTSECQTAWGTDLPSLPCTVSDYQSASSASAAKCRPGSHKSWSQQASVSDLGGDGDGLHCYQNHPAMAQQCLECRTYCVQNLTGTKYAVVGEQQKTGSCDRTKLEEECDAIWMAPVYGNSWSFGSSPPLTCSESTVLMDWYKCVSSTGCCGDTSATWMPMFLYDSIPATVDTSATEYSGVGVDFATYFTHFIVPQIDIGFNHLLFDWDGCTSPVTISKIRCPLETTPSDWASVVPTVKGDCPTTASALIDPWAQPGMRRVPNCPATGLQEFFRTSANPYPNQFTEAEYNNCTSSYLCVSYCDECEAGTFDYGHASGLDSNCKDNTNTACKVCGYLTGVAGGMTMTCGASFSSNDACGIIGRHDCPSGTEAPRRDVVGAYSNACTNCPAGKFGPGGVTSAGQSLLSAITAASTTVPTMAEMVAVFETAEPCTFCPAGKFTSSSAQSQCTTCTGAAPFLYTDGQGSSSCKTCPSGSYVTENSCLKCPVGHKCTQGAKTACYVTTSQANGELRTDYQDVEGQSTCKQCGQGEGAGGTVSARTSCKQCSASNEYSDDGSGCKNCARGSYTNAAKTTCTACEKGSSCVDGIKTPCPGGMYSDAAGQDQCKTCTDGSYTAIRPGAMSCAACPIGTYLPANSSAADHDRLEDCLPCGAETFNDAVGQTQCKPHNKCSGTNQQVLKPGSTKVDAVCSCKSGSGSSSPDPLNCVLCEGNTYTEAPGTVACKSCPTDKIGSTKPYTCQTFADSQTSCGGVASNTSAICPGGSKWTTTPSSSTIHYLTAQDWPPYQCSDTYAQNFKGNEQCVSDHCEGAVYGDSTINSGRMEVVPEYCVLPATVCTTGEPLENCQATSTLVSYSCRYRCKAGFKPGSPWYDLVCRGGSVSAGTQPLFMKKINDQITCSQVECPSDSTGKVDEGCVVSAGYAGTVTASTADPYYIGNITACAAGTAAVEGVGQCTPCQAGEYQSQAGQATCLPCAAGGVQSRTGQIVCTGCVAGKYTASQGQTTCESCAAGKYQDQAEQTTCSACDAGTFQSAEGETSCTACAAGTVSAMTGQTTCESCAAGKYQDQAKQTTCSACDAGTFQSAEGQTSCTACAAGTVSNMTGQTTCESCAAGKYQDQAKQTTCKAWTGCSGAQQESAAGTEKTDKQCETAGWLIAVIVVVIVGAIIVGLAIYKSVTSESTEEQGSGSGRNGLEEEDITASPPHHDLESESESDQDDAKAADGEESNVEADEVELDSEN